MTDEQQYEPSFAELGILNVDRLQRALDELRHQFQAADEYLLRARAAERGAVLVEHVTVDNKHVQSISVAVQRDNGGHVTVMVAHRGTDGMMSIPSGSMVEFDV